jgi:threonylcarbamoyladenosine tRNA methylthiotransferase MtaB
MKEKPVVRFHTLGCKLNQAESEEFALKFSRAGYRVTRGDIADICILNTCTVTHIADRKSRHMLRLMRKKNPRAVIIAAGCYAQRAAEELIGMGVDLVVSNQEKNELVRMVDNIVFIERDCLPGCVTLDGAERVRSFIKIQDGCDAYCAYCIVPLVRGPGFCLLEDEIIDMINSRVASGYKEVVLTGTKIGVYNDEGIGLQHLLQRILSETQIARLHVSSLQPQELSEDMLNLWQDARLCRHFHIALQSGSDAVLKRMRRRYSILDYKKTVANIRKALPGAAITTDIMVGFPGESDEEFELSYLFCKETKFAAIHVFSYSRRPGTAAAALPGHLGDKLKKERSQRMLELAKSSALSFTEHFLGNTEIVLWENEDKPGSGLYSGLTASYIRVFTRSKRFLTGRLLPAKLIKTYRDGTWGELAE